MLIFPLTVMRNHHENLSLLPSQQKSVLWDARLVQGSELLFSVVASREGSLRLLELGKVLLELISGTISQCCEVES